MARSFWNCPLALLMESYRDGTSDDGLEPAKLKFRIHSGIRLSTDTTRRSEHVEDRLPKGSIPFSPRTGNDRPSPPHFRGFRLVPRGRPLLASCGSAQRRFDTRHLETDITLRLVWWTARTGPTSGQAWDSLTTMLTAFARHSVCDLKLHCRGDLHVIHHTVEGLWTHRGKLLQRKPGRQEGRPTVWQFDPHKPGTGEGLRPHGRISGPVRHRLRWSSVSGVARIGRAHPHYCKITLDENSRIIVGVSFRTRRLPGLRQRASAISTSNCSAAESPTMWLRACSSPLPGRWISAKDPRIATRSPARRKAVSFNSQYTPAQYAWRRTLLFPTVRSKGTDGTHSRVNKSGTRTVHLHVVETGLRSGRGGVGGLVPARRYGGI